MYSGALGKAAWIGVSCAVLEGNRSDRLNIAGSLANQGFVLCSKISFRKSYGDHMLILLYASGVSGVSVTVVVVVVVLSTQGKLPYCSKQLLVYMTRGMAHEQLVFVKENFTTTIN